MDANSVTSERHALRVAGILMGDIERNPGIWSKYWFLFEQLSLQLPLVEVIDARLEGLPKYVAALMTLRPDRHSWRERYYKNVPSFKMRSRQVAAYLGKRRDQIDVSLQLGVLFDASWVGSPVPNVIYTDYTARLSARVPEAGRSPFNARAQEAWIALERGAYQRAAHICTRSQLAWRSIVHDYGIPPERVTVVGGGVNFPSLPDLGDRTAPEVPTALFIGKDFYRKGGDLLLQAFARVREGLPEARLILVTGDPVPAGLPLSGVEVVKPTWDRELVAALYRSADVFVLPSRLETWGDVLLEAMAFELPCVAVASDAMDEIIVDGETGLLIERHDVGALAQALRIALEDRQRARSWGLAGRRRVEAHFTWERVMERISPILVDASRRPNAVALL